MITSQYDNNQNIVHSETAKINEEIYKASEKTIINLRTSNGYIETNYKKMTTQIIAIQDIYRYKITLEWKNIPSKRGYDII